jgi:uncharacterized protein with HEPN domain
VTIGFVVAVFWQTQKLFMPVDLATALDIVLACRRIGKFLISTDEASFLDDEEKHWAVASQLMLIGEAARRLSEEFRLANPSVPWSQYTGMRNRLAHQYDAINWSIVWITASEEIPELLTTLEPIVPQEDV